jgi:hypothetical protein
VREWRDGSREWYCRDDAEAKREERRCGVVKVVRGLRHFRVLEKIF